MRSSGNSRRWSDHLLHLLLNPSCQQQRVHLLRKRVSKLYGIQVSEAAPMQGHGLRFIYRDTEFDPEYDILVKLPYLSLCSGARNEPCSDHTHDPDPDHAGVGKPLPSTI